MTGISYTTVSDISSNKASQTWHLPAYIESREQKSLYRRLNLYFLENADYDGSGFADSLYRLYESKHGHTAVDLYHMVPGSWQILTILPSTFASLSGKTMSQQSCIIYDWRSTEYQSLSSQRATAKQESRHIQGRIYDGWLASTS